MRKRATSSMCAEIEDDEVIRFGEVGLLAVDIVARAERHARPRRLADCTGIDDFMRLAEGRKEPRVLMHHERDASGSGGLDDGDAILPARRKRLLHDHGKPVACRQTKELRMRLHRRDDVDEVERLAGQHLRCVLVRGARPIALSGSARLADVEVADGSQDHILHAGPSRQMVFGEETAADQSDPERG